MEKRDWYEAGEQIRQLVQDAVDSRDFSQLSSTITNVVNSTVDGIQSALKENLARGGTPGAGQAADAAGTQRQGMSSGAGSAQTSGQTAGGAGTQRQGMSSGAGSAQTSGQTAGGAGTQRQGMSSGAGSAWTSGQAAGGAGTRRQETSSGAGGAGTSGQVRTAGREYSNRAAADEIRRRLQEKHRQQMAERPSGKSLPARVKAPGELMGRALKWFGCGMGGILGLSLAIVAIVSFTTGADLILPILILALLTIVNFFIASRGAEQLNMAKRFRRYVEVIGDRTSCMLEELAGAVGRNMKFVRRDVRDMIKRGYFKEGYLDRREETLITDHTAYQRYLEAEKEKDLLESAGRARKQEKEAEEKADAAQERKDSRALTPECRELIEEGRKYIRHVQECNEKIEDPQMSAKLDRLELVITRIFRETEKNPSVAGDLRKMMSYYLPTTRKLLDAYCEMNAQPIRGQNIEKTQREIEGALDTINTAFENLLDSFFEDRAWDISSDITVLNTMMAQDGLTGNDFERKQQGGRKNE